MGGNRKQLCIPLVARTACLSVFTAAVALLMPLQAMPLHAGKMFTSSSQPDSRAALAEATPALTTAPKREERAPGIAAAVAGLWVL